MPKSGVDQDALIEMFANASTQQADQLRQAITQATLGGLQSREMTLKNIRAVIKSVTEAASTGAARNTTPQVDVQQMLHSAVAGVDDALLKAVEANRVALERFVDQGVGLREAPLQQALSDLEKMEDSFFASLKKVASQASEPAAGPWAEVLGQFRQQGSAAGAQAQQTAEQITEQMRTTLRDTRAAGLKAAQALAHSYTALVSGVLMGMSDALRQQAAAAAAPEPAPAPAPAPAAKRSRKTAA